jgi:hypothetical protein
MNSAITEGTQEQEIRYPRLMRGLEKDKAVVLFISRREGVVVHGSASYEVGYFSRNWVSADDFEQWESFTGTVTLSN